MSDPMSNREIEDVLTSIRRLVAQEGDRAPAPGPAGKGRLVLTEAQRIDPAPLLASRRPANDGPILLTPDLSVDQAPELSPEVRPEPAAHAPVPAVEVTIPAPDFGRLEATIAELEAAVTAAGDGFEGADSDEAPKASNVTELYGRLSFAHRQTPDPETRAPAAAPEIATRSETVTQRTAEPAREDPTAIATSPDTAARIAATPMTAAVQGPSAQAMSFADPAALRPDPDSPAAPDAGLEDTILDEDTLRELIAQIVREELRGALGERITQQVRKLVRAEVAKALDDRGFL